MILLTNVCVCVYRVVIKNVFPNVNKKLESHQFTQFLRFIIEKSQCENSSEGPHRGLVGSIVFEHPLPTRI